MKNYAIMIMIFGLTSFAYSYDLFDGAKNVDSMKPYNPSIENYSIETEKLENNESNVLDDLTNIGDGFFEKGQYVDALEAYNVVVSQAKSTTLKDKSNLLRAICGSLLSYDCLNEDQLAESSFNKLVEMTNLFNKDLDNMGWIKNSPVYSHYKQNIKGRIKASNSECEECNQKKRFGDERKNAIPDMTAEENCVLQCNGYAVAVVYACSRVPNAAIQFICIGCVFGLEQACIRCCKGEGFWANCVKSLRRLYHDPEHPEHPAPHPFE